MKKLLFCFRPVRGGFEEAMFEKKVFDNLSEFVLYIEKKANQCCSADEICNYKFSDLCLFDFGYDDRIPAYTAYICSPITVVGHVWLEVQDA